MHDDLAVDEPRSPLALVREVLLGRDPVGDLHRSHRRPRCARGPSTVRGRDRSNFAPYDTTASAPGMTPNTTSVTSPTWSPSTCSGIGAPVGGDAAQAVDVAEVDDLALADERSLRRQHAQHDRRDVARRGAAQRDAGQRAGLQAGALGDRDRLVVEVGELLGVLDDRRDRALDAAVDVDVHARRVAQVVAGDGLDAGIEKEVLAQLVLLELGRQLDALDDGRVDPVAARVREGAPVGRAEVDLARAPVVGHAEQVLGRVDDVAGDAEHLAQDVRRAAGQAGDRRGAAGEAVGDLVDGPVAAEGDDDVVALAGRLAAQLGRVAARLRVDRLDLVAPVQRGDDEVAQPRRHRASPTG